MPIRPLDAQHAQIRFKINNLFPEKKSKNFVSSTPEHKRRVTYDNEGALVGIVSSGNSSGASAEGSFVEGFETAFVCDTRSAKF
mmetsp:Transcript_43355/g.101715  ORF Transcript_43355/g.101715 Transcript_43355/m.101715 type:complete len:84 (-) Transcript_43355:57-308(-)